MGASRFGSVQVNEAPGLGDFGLPVAEATAGAVTYTMAQLASKLLLRDCAGAGRADLLPTAATIIAYMQSVLGALPDVGQFIEFHIRNTSGGAFTITVTTNTGLTLSGTMTIAQNASGVFRAVVTGATTVTVYRVGAYTH